MATMCLSRYGQYMYIYGMHRLIFGINASIYGQYVSIYEMMVINLMRRMYQPEIVILF